MGVAAEVLEDVSGAAEGRFGIDYPCGSLQGGQPGGEGGWIAQRLQIAEELELAGGVGLVQGLEETVGGSGG